MKRSLIVVILSAVANFCFGQVAIYDISENGIKTKKDMVSDNYIGDLTHSYPLRSVNTYHILENQYGRISLELLRFRDCEGDPGDFNVIKLFNDNKEILEILNHEDYMFLSRYMESEGDFLNRKVADDYSILLFLEQLYPTGPSHVTIVVIYKGKAYYVFNREAYIKKITNTRDRFELDLQLNIVEMIDEDTTYNEAEYARLYFDRNVLWYEQL